MSDLTWPMGCELPASDSGLAWAHRFHELGPAFYTELRPTPLPAPFWVARDPALARALGLAQDWLASQDALEVFSGNRPLAGARPLASVYSGHQFGVWAGQLGDGRAILLGETASGQEIQLKGAGRTPYSRSGDGRAVLRSSIREFLCSAAMQGLGIPSTQALCITGSPAPVQRETLETAAVVTRVAPSFVRFGHFEHFAASGQQAQLRQLADWVLARWYPECLAQDGPPGRRYAALLQAVALRTAELMAQWQAVGFCHGVMNTDNMSILGLTLDYGPFQFMDAFDPGHICNHSDHQGRYAWQRQPQVAHWNLFCLAQALMPLIGEQALALQALQHYAPAYASAQQRRWGAKLGLDAQTLQDGDAALIDATLQALERDRVDFPLFWSRLSDAVARWAEGQAADQAWATLSDGLFDAGADVPAWRAWWARLLARLHSLDRVQAAHLMRRHNPRYVLRNHLAQQAIEQAQAGDCSEVARLLKILQAPFDPHPGCEAYAQLPPAWASGICISCSS